MRVTASMVDAREAVDERRSARELECTTLSASRSRMMSSLTEHSCTVHPDNPSHISKWRRKWTIMPEGDGVGATVGDAEGVRVGHRKRAVDVWHSG